MLTGFQNINVKHTFDIVLFGMFIIAVGRGDYKTTGINFLLTVILVLIAFNGLCELIEKVLVEIYNKQ